MSKHCLQDFAGMSKMVMLGYLNEPIFFVILGTITLDIINDDYCYMKIKVLEQRTQAKSKYFVGSYHHI